MDSPNTDKLYTIIKANGGNTNDFRGTAKANENLSLTLTIIYVVGLDFLFSLLMQPYKGNPPIWILLLVIAPIMFVFAFYHTNLWKGAVYTVITLLYVYGMNHTTNHWTQPVAILLASLGAMLMIPNDYLRNVQLLWGFYVALPKACWLALRNRATLNGARQELIGHVSYGITTSGEEDAEVVETEK